MQMGNGKPNSDIVLRPMHIFNPHAGSCPEARREAYDFLRTKILDSAFCDKKCFTFTEASFSLSHSEWSIFNRPHA